MKSHLHFVKGLDPVADAFAGIVSTDIVSMRGHKTVEFIIHKGVGATGRSVITVEACDDVTPSNTTAVPFRYQPITSDDTHGELTECDAAGFTTIAGSSQLYRVIVNTDDIKSTGYGFVRLKATESVNDPVLGGVLVIMRDPMIDKSVQDSVLA